jgi:iron complex transport system substrate-binding protein
VHCAAFIELEALNVIKGVCEPEYINIGEITSRVANGAILNLGRGASPDIEKIIDLNPDAIFAAPISGTTFGQIEKTNFPLVQTPDYMEHSSLGWAEWIRFYSLFLKKEELGDSLFNTTKNNYNTIKNSVKDLNKRPMVLTDTKYENTWYVAGGKSYIANMYHDAGAITPWDDNSSSGSIPLSFEAVLDKAENADIWLIKYNQKEEMTYHSLNDTYSGYSYFDAYKNKTVYACNMNRVSYYEDLAIHPDWILNDLVAIFHPELYPGYQLKYYSKLKE